MRDIAHDIGRDRVAAVVATFYSRVRQHATLAGPFARVHDWPHHLEILTHFWWVSLGGERYLDYSYQVPAKHAEAGFTPALFQDTLLAELPPEQAVPWIERARKIGTSLNLLYELGHFGGADNSH